MGHNISRGAAGFAALAFCVAATSFGSASAATVTIDGTVYDEAAFADSASLDSGTFRVEVASTPEAALIGSDITTVASCVNGSGSCSFTAYFTDNVAINGAGDDLIFFLLGGNGSELFDVTIGGVTLANQGGQWSGAYNSLGKKLLTYTLNLDLFGVAASETINSISIFLTAGGTNPEEFLALAALYSGEVLVNPVPGALPLMITGLFGGWFAKRRQKKQA